MEAELLRPVVRGRDIEAWRFTSPGYIIWTHDDNGNPLEALPKHAEEYFSKYKKKLMARNDYRKQQPYWVIFRVSKGKLGAKVGWQELSKMMEAVIIESRNTDSKLGERLLVPLQTVYFVAADNLDLNFGIAGLLNSTIARAFISSFSMREMGQPPRFRHISWTVGLVPLSSEFTKRRAGTILKKIIQISKNMHACKGENKKLAEELDKRVAELYAVSDEELFSLNQYLNNLGVPAIHQCAS